MAIPADLLCMHASVQGVDSKFNVLICRSCVTVATK